MSFSERYGFKPVRQAVQIDSMDEPLRNGLWSLLNVFCWNNVRHSTGLYGGYYLSSPGNEELQTLCKRLWFNYFKKPLDKLDHDWTKVLREIREYFFTCEWYEVYDFVEFVAHNYDRYEFKKRFIDSCNQLLEKEMSAYRFVDGIITRITEPHEIAAVEDAIAASLGPVQIHLHRALELLSDRNAPDYRNSIKESISAVESLVANTLRTDKGH